MRLQSKWGEGWVGATSLLVSDSEIILLFNSMIFLVNEIPCIVVNYLSESEFRNSYFPSLCPFIFD